MADWFSIPFYWSFTDFKGKTARVSSSSFQIRNVEDSQDPSPVVVEPYTTITDDTYEVAEHKLANNVNISSSPILIYPIYATDNANGYVDNNLELYRVIRNTSNNEIFNEQDINENLNEGNGYFSDKSRREKIPNIIENIETRLDSILLKVYGFEKDK